MEFSVAMMADYLAASIRIASPLLFAALGGILSERAGVFAISLEGMMLVGALAGVIGAFFAGTVWVGVLCSMLGGGILGVLLAVATVTFRANQIVATIALNILALGATNFIFRIVFGTGEEAATRIATMPVLAIPLLSEIPLLGEAVFRQPALTYLAYVAVPVLMVILFRTYWGLNIRAVGEHPRAAHVVGVSPAAVRYAAVIACGGLAGLGGAVLALQQVGFFSEGMTQGRGFIALAAVIFGRWHPAATAAACLMFGAAEALQLRIQAFGLPLSSHIVLMVPYLVAIATLLGFGLRARYPSAIGRPYGGNEG